MDELMRSTLLRHIGQCQRAVVRAQLLLERRQERLTDAYRQLEQAKADAAEDRLIEARERLEEIWQRATGKRVA